jgi:hypothetical protein
MPWSNSTTYPFNETSVILNAPAESGVYALYNKTTWVYVGESSNILAQLVQHLNGDVACITMFPDLGFSYELHRPGMRAWRLQELISEFRPVCNPSLSRIPLR